MTAETFSAWADHMVGLGYSQAKMALLLGTTANQILRWRRNGAPKYIGLACKAIELGFTPWTPADATPITCRLTKN